MYIIDTHGVLPLVWGAIWNGLLIFIGMKIEQHYSAPRRAKAKQRDEHWEPREPKL